ncbi:pre-mRNA-splicing factor syf1 [Coemansia sp. RSA 1836]|nr:pre-mRNA-splicing factor syf1 [Coemansia sp. RSA 1836]
MDVQIDIADDDLRFEEEVLREPHKLKGWLRYIEHKQASNSIRSVTVVFERAVKRLPGSYKLWKLYLEHRQTQLSGKSPLHFSEDFRRVNLCFERSLLLLHKMPRIWLMYAGFMTRQADVTAARRVFDRALRALPVTQHHRIWLAYLKFARQVGGLAAERVYARYVQMWPDRVGDFIDWCVGQGRWAEAARRLISAIDSEAAPSGASAAAAWWRQLAHIMRAQPKAVAELRVEPILRDGIMRGTSSSSDVGELWAALASHFVARGLVDQARDVYEEAVGSVRSVKDFAMVFDAYAAFEEAGVAAALDAEAERVAAGGGGDATQTAVHLDLQMLRLERLMDRRPFLANDVVLRQTPHSVAAWLRRVALWQRDADEAQSDQKVIDTFESALKSVDPARATGGSVAELWLAYARHFGGDRMSEFRSVMDRAVAAPLASREDLADLYVAYAQAELESGHVESARRVLARATSSRASKSLRVWSLLIDIEEGAGSVAATRAAYDRVLSLRIATPQTVVDYAQYLEDHSFFEDSFRVYERGIAAFGYPVAIDLWNVYLARFVKRYAGEKLERTRDLFEQALAGCPARYAQSIFLAYGRLEEEHGLARRALRVYERAAVGGVVREQKLEMYRFYAAKTAELLGLPATRLVYERGIAELGDKAAVALALDYAQAECRLAEIDRARAIYAYAAPMVDPRTATATADALAWTAWHEFEVQHGNEDTFKEMLRVKRLAQTKLNTDARFLAAAEIEQQKQKQQAKLKKDAEEKEKAEADGGGPVSNPDALDIDDDDL